MALSIASLEGEESGYPQSEWIESNFRAVRRLIVGWEDRRELLDQLATPPNDEYPYDEGTPNALARRAKIYPLPKQEQINASGSDIAVYRKAIVEVEYSTVGPSWYRSNLIRETLTPSTQRAALDSQHFRWSNQTTDGTFGNNNVVVLSQETPTRSSRAFDWTIEYWHLMALPLWIEAPIGCVNSNPVPAPTLGYVFPPESLLYKGSTITRTVKLNMVLTQTVKAHFGVIFPTLADGGGTMQRNWNMHWRASQQRYGWLKTVTGNIYRSYPRVPFQLPHMS